MSFNGIVNHTWRDFDSVGEAYGTLSRLSLGSLLADYKEALTPSLDQVRAGEDPNILDLKYQIPTPLSTRCPRSCPPNIAFLPPYSVSPTDVTTPCYTYSGVCVEASAFANFLFGFVLGLAALKLADINSWPFESDWLRTEFGASGFRVVTG